ncbi:MAG: Crp/Fnr family transcriptional regulator [Caldilineaceae bacterium]
MKRVYRRGDPIVIAPDTVLEIEQGVVIKIVIHLDGAEVLLGFHGAGHIVMPHPEDSCHIQLGAHTEVHAQILSWQTAVQRAELPNRLRAQIWQQEAWAAMQARPAYEDRLLGILSLLAEQFGHAHDEGALIDLRITHQQLASAIGATRSTVARLLSELRAPTDYDAGQRRQERICLRHIPAASPLTNPNLAK